MNVIAIINSVIDIILGQIKALEAAGAVVCKSPAQMGIFMKHVRTMRQLLINAYKPVNQCYFCLHVYSVCACIRIVADVANFGCILRHAFNVHNTFPISVYK